MVWLAVIFIVPVREGLEHWAALRLTPTRDL